MAEAEEAAALATRLMDAANRYEQDTAGYHPHHDEVCGFCLLFVC